MATEVAVEAGGVLFPAEDVQLEAAEVSKQPQKLERQWSFWFDNQSKKQGAAWGSSLRQVYTFDTVEEFWCLYDHIFKPSKLPVNADFHLFKTGIEPKWEDPACANGGKWTVPSNGKATLDNLWLETLMALIGEQIDSEEICGVVASVRQRGDRLSLWTKNASNEAVQMSIGRKWKEVIDFADKINYGFHVSNNSVIKTNTFDSNRTIQNGTGLQKEDTACERAFLNVDQVLDMIILFSCFPRHSNF